MERLYRSKTNRVVAGVCGGFAEYFHIDPTIIRIIWILISLSGAGILAYIVAAIIMPDEAKVTGTGSRTGWNESPQNDGRSTWNESPKTGTEDFTSGFQSEKDSWEQPPKYNSERSRFVLGAILVGLGILFLGNQILPRLFELKYLVPVLLIGIGGFIVLRGRR